MHVVLFHHALGLTDGVRSFADSLRMAGHEVATPDLYGGEQFADLESGVAYAEGIGFAEIADLGFAAAEEMPADSVYAGFSLGLLPAQKLAQTRAGARGALLYHDVVAPGFFSPAWPTGVPVQMHVSEEDEWADMDEVQALAAKDNAELFIYPGSAHLFAEPGSGEYNRESAGQLLVRSLAFLERLG